MSLSLMPYPLGGIVELMDVVDKKSYHSEDLSEIGGLVDFGERKTKIVFVADVGEQTTVNIGGTDIKVVQADPNGRQMEAIPVVNVNDALENLVNEVLTGTEDLREVWERSMGWDWDHQTGFQLARSGPACIINHYTMESGNRSHPRNYRERNNKITGQSRG